MIKNIRKPKQLRSIQMKEKILKAAYRLFCEKGFYKTTTNEIAKTAGVSIGSLYSYFKDRETILFEILELYHQQFIEIQNEFNVVSDNITDKKVLIHNLIENLIRNHEKSKKFNKELKVLYYSNPKVAAIMDKQNKETQQIIINLFSLWKDEIKIEDLEAAAIVSFEIISAIVDRIVFGERVDRDRILQTGVNALFKFLML